MIDLKPKENICRVEAEIDVSDPQSLKIKNIKLSGNCSGKDLSKLGIIENA